MKNQKVDLTSLNEKQLEVKMVEATIKSESHLRFISNTLVVVITIVVIAFVRYITR